MAINQCGLQAAESNRAVLRYIPEDPDCWGVTPTTGKTREMRITSSSLAAEKETVVSNELRADRMVSDVIETAASSGGEINVEFSAGSLDDFLQAFVLGGWTRPMTFDKFEGANVSVLDNAGTTEIKIAGDDYRKYFTTGRRIKTEGFINPANNDYWTINSLSFSSGVTTIVTTGSTGVTEAGRDYSRVLDSNDVIIFKNTDIRAGTAGAKTFDSDGTNAFASAIAAGQLVVGQKIYVNGLGYETGTITIAGAKESGSFAFATTAEVGDQLTVDDGVNDPVQFTFANAAAGLTTVAIGVSASDSATNLATAINNHPALNVTATPSTGTVNIVNDNYVGGALTEQTDGGTDITTTNFSGGTATVVDGDTIIINDGERSMAFEFDSDSAFTRGATGVTIGASAAATAANLQEAIMDQLWKKKVTVSASVSSTTVTVRNLNRNQIANAATSGITDVEDGSAITVVNFAGATGSFGVFTITALDNDVITVAEDVATNANTSPVAVTIKGSHLRNPGDLAEITPQSFSVETGFTDVGQYFKQTGLRVGSFGINVASGELVGGTLNFQGKETTIGQVSTLGSAPYDVLASTATPVLNATTNVGSIYKNGEQLATALQSIELNGEAALREQRAVGSRFPAGIGTGRFNLTGTFTSYFETLEMYDHFLNHDTISLAFDFTDNDNSVYWFTIPALKITSDPVAPGGIDQDVLEELEFVAIRDPGLNTMFMVDRFSSVLPATS